MSKNSKIYFAADEPKETASSLLKRAESWYNQLDSNGYLEKLRMMWAAYHGAYYTDFSDGHSINFGGEQGETVNIAVNHLRNLAQHMKNMITSNRPSLKARAVNTDHKSLVQARLANGLLDYYMRDKRLEEYLVTAVEYALVLGSGYIKMEWNSQIGEIYDFNEETGVDIREGDVEFENLSPFDVIFDSSREDQNHDWVLCRSFKLRYDIIAKYPEYEAKILDLPSKADLQSYYLENSFYSETDLIPVYEFYHKRSESMPDGRYLMFLDGDLVLSDSPMPYRDLPIYRIAPANILGSPYGYTPLFDILPIQDAINSLYSTILTNQNAFGVQNILVPRGADVSISELSGGLNIVEANTQYGEIKPLNLTQTPKEVFDFLGMLESVQETISGVSSVSRGNPEASLKSGSALALVQSMSLQFMSGLQHSYVRLVEDVGTGLINILKDFAEVPRIAMISGVRNKTSMKEFTNDDLSSVNRIVVDISNPLANTTAGRLEIANELLQKDMLDSHEQYFMILNTGNLDVLTETVQSDLDLIKDENERLTEGKEVIVIATDNHDLHIKEHRSILSDSELRFDPELVDRSLEHIQAHLDALRNTDPDLLNIIKEQPLSPIGGSPANQPGMEAQSPQQVPQQMMPLQPQMPMVPAPAVPPAPFNNLPTNPEDIIPQ